MSSETDAWVGELARAELLLSLNRAREAGFHAARAVAAAPTEAGGWHALARCHLACDEPRQALDAVNRAIGLDPDSAPSHVLASEALAALGLTRESIRAAREATRLAPLSSAAHATLAIALTRLPGQRELFGLVYPRHLREARLHAKRAIELAPADTIGHFSAAFVEARIGHSRQARKLYRRVLAIHPEHAKAMNNLAVLDLRSGRFSRSGAGFRNALASDPTFTLARRNIERMLGTAVMAFHFVAWLIYFCFSGIAGQTHPAHLAFAWTTRCAVALCLGIAYALAATTVFLRLGRRIRAFAWHMFAASWALKTAAVVDAAMLSCFIIAVLGKGAVASAVYQFGMLGAVLGFISLARAARAHRGARSRRGVR